MNLNILKSTIQGLEVHHATMMALKSFGDAVSAASATATAPSEESVTKTKLALNHGKPQHAVVAKLATQPTSTK
ncbi:hypothetical protein [Polynucleobacter necessarius]|uniref:hypothetical protein n=1 Tax=Polynucleobacter necessarius TaxID=576610 RepID=UPI0018D543F1|nr:hypothetical protein [Polynucleobacter necessarius]